MAAVVVCEGAHNVSKASHTNVLVPKLASVCQDPCCGRSWRQKRHLWACGASTAAAILQRKFERGWPVAGHHFPSCSVLAIVSVALRKGTQKRNAAIALHKHPPSDRGGSNNDGPKLPKSKHREHKDKIMCCAMLDPTVKNFEWSDKGCNSIGPSQECL